MSQTHKYIPKIPQREENLFLEEYYSGTDVKVYIDDNQQSEISYINYSVNEQLKPIYGYASRTFDDISVGNRIITGVLKMPIRNPEEQSTYEEVIVTALTTAEEIESKNNQEIVNRNNTEWTGNTSTSTSETVASYSSNEIFEYQNKLIKLGYSCSATGYLDKETRVALKKFQEDNSLTISDYFNNDTRNEIDLAVDLSSTSKGHTNSITNVYYGLSTTMGRIVTLPKNSAVYIINDLGNGFIQIRTTDGKDGYVEASNIS